MYLLEKIDKCDAEAEGNPRCLLHLCNEKTFSFPNVLEKPHGSGAIAPTFQIGGWLWVSTGDKHLKDSQGPCLTLEKLVMKKTLIALAAVAATGAAFAQSSVTISGGYGLALGQTKIGADNSGMQIARQTGNIQFAGSEDLGGGLRAGFALQSSIGGVATTNTDNGTTGALTNRTILGDRAANVSLSGGFGSFVLGRGNTAIRSLWGAIGDVSQSPVVSGLSAGSGTSDAAARVIYGDTFSNYVAYTTPNMSGFTATVGLAPTQSVAGATAVLNAGDTAATKDTMSYTLQYAKGPLAAAVNISDQAQTGNVKLTTILASYDLGVAKIGLTQQSIDMNDGSTNPGDGTAITIAAPMGAGILSAGYGMRKATAAVGVGDDVKQTHFGYRYNLSKRTHLNLISNKINRAGAAADVTETHLVVGHTF